MIKRSVVLLVSCTLVSLAGCGGGPLSDDDVERIARRVDERIYPKLTAIIQQEFVALKEDVRRSRETAALAVPATPIRTTSTPVEAPTGDDAVVVLSIQGGTKLTEAQFEDIYVHKTRLMPNPQFRNLTRRQVFDSVCNVELLATHAATERVQETSAFQQWAGSQLTNEMITLLFGDLERQQPPLDETTIRRHYEQTKVLYRTQPYLTVYVLEVGDENRADELYRTLQQHPDKFTELVQAHSTHPSKSLDGRLDRIYPGVLSADLYHRLEQATLDTVLEPWKTQSGQFAIYKVTARHAAATSPYEVVRGQVLKALQERRREELFTSLETEAGKHVTAALHEDLAAADGAPADELARVDTVVITREILENALSQLPGKQKQQFGTPQGKKQFLRSLYRRALFAAYAQQDQNYQQRHGNYLNYSKREKLAQFYVQQKVKPQTDVSDADVEAYYRTNLDRFKAPHPFVRTRQVFFGAVQRTDEAFATARERAASVIERVRKGEKLEDIARAESQHQPTRGQGGFTDWSSRDVGRFGTAYYDATTSLAPGQVTTEPVKESNPPGYFVVQLLERTPHQPLDFVSGALKEQLHQARGREELQTLLNDIRAKGSVTVRTAELERRDAADAAAKQQTASGTQPSDSASTATRDEAHDALLDGQGEDEEPSSEP